MDRLWGDFLPVPPDRVRALKGEERIRAGGRDLEVATRPGHASHHVTYFDSSTRVAFVGGHGGNPAAGPRPRHATHTAAGY